ncbi:MAG: hypothetical protein KCHDKBKB_02669 [Elusimicrobia bacterium]|nr:hypothetical protein [Elusimicrobiota bacterium]
MAMFAICVSVATTSTWALVGLGDIKFDGSLEVSGNAANNEVDFGNDPDNPGISGTGTSNDHRGRTATRVRLGMDAVVTEGVTSRLELIRDARQYGDSNGPTSIATEEGLWRFHNAYVDIQDLWGHNFRLGRQYVGNPGDLVWNISPTDDDSLTNNSIDGLLIQCRKFDFIHADLFTGKSTEDDAIANTDQDDATGDVNLTSLDFVLPKLVPGAKLNLGYLLGDDANSNLENDNNHLRTARVGINGGVSENMFTYRAELFSNMGEFAGMGLDSAGAATKLKYEGTAIDFGVGFNSKETSAGTFGVALNYLMASGDDNAIDDKDESFHDFSVMGINTSDRLLGEIFGKSNTMGGGTPLGQGINTAQASGAVATAAPGTTTQGQGLNVLNLGVQYKPTFCKKSTFRLDYFTFSRSEDEVKTAANTNTKVGEDFGSEFDLAYVYDHTSNVNVELGYAMFSPDDALVGVNSTNQDDDVTKLYARTKIKWGGDAE